MNILLGAIFGGAFGAAIAYALVSWLLFAGKRPGVIPPTSPFVCRSECATNHQRRTGQLGQRGRRAS